MGDAGTKHYISAVDRLLALPEAFSTATLCTRFSWTSSTASSYLQQWKKRGLVAPLGGHSDAYANLVRQPRPNWELPLLAYFPGAIIMGEEVLRRAGWTTQIPSRPAVAILRKPFKSHHFSFERRSERWFEAMKARALARSNGAGLTHAHQLRPAWALAEMLSKDRCWPDIGFGADDIDWDVVASSDTEDLRAAFGHFKLPIDDLVPSEALL